MECWSSHWSVSTFFAFLVVSVFRVRSVLPASLFLFRVGGNWDSLLLPNVQHSLKPQNWKGGMGIQSCGQSMVIILCRRLFGVSFWRMTSLSVHHHLMIIFANWPPEGSIWTTQCNELLKMPLLYTYLLRLCHCPFVDVVGAMLRQCSRSVCFYIRSINSVENGSPLRCCL